MEREHFCCCMSVKVLVNTTMIAGGRKESTTKDLKTVQVEFGSRSSSGSPGVPVVVYLAIAEGRLATNDV